MSKIDFQTGRQSSFAKNMTTTQDILYAPPTWLNTQEMKIDLRQKKRIGLVLSGGGIKAAAFHVGVCLALQEKGFKFAGGSKNDVEKQFPEDDPKVIRLYVGSSAGSFIASILAAGYKVEALIEALNLNEEKKFSKKHLHSLHHLKPFKYRDFFSINSSNILKTIPLSIIRKSILSGGFETLLKDRFTLNGFFTADNLEKYLREYAFTQNEFSKLGVQLYIIGTQLNHSRKVLFGDFAESTKNRTEMRVNYASISQAVAASISLPPVFAPYKIRNPESKKDMYFFDGEIRDSLSTHVASDNGADLIIASYSYQPYQFSDDIGSLDQFGLPVILNQALYQVIQQKIDRNIQIKNDHRLFFYELKNYLEKNNVDNTTSNKLLDSYKKHFRFKPEVDYIYIHPRPQNHEMFFADHFSLNNRILESIVKQGFKSAISQLRNYNL